MTQKFGQARKEAFLQALSETGNRTLAAEAAKVSRSWVGLQRKRDRAFRQACNAALAEAKDRLSAHPDREPPSGWGFLDGEELVVKGTGGSGGGKRVQIARARLRQWTPRAEERFLSALAATCNVRAACAEVGLTPASAYSHRRRWPAFARRWDAAVDWAYARLEAGLVEHACNLFSGEGPPVFSETPPMSFADAVRLLHMHKHAVRGIGKRPGQVGRAPEWDEVRASILRKMDAIDRMDARRLAEDQAEWARRRGSGRG